MLEYSKNGDLNIWQLSAQIFTTMRDNSAQQQLRQKGVALQVHTKDTHTHTHNYGGQVQILLPQVKAWGSEESRRFW